MARKKNTQIEEPVVEVQETDLLDEGEESFYSDAVSFLPVFNKTRKAYDMWILRVNTYTKEVEIEVEECKYDSIHRATFDLQQRYANEFIRGGKK